ncbi:MAG: serine/threonine protein kinase, partial [Akkermansiaceae bacterium]|nr:serine/threonine protein kinase [Akkermansiaceae bacterium]
MSDLKTIQNETLVGEPMNPGQGQSGAARFPFLAPAEKPGLLGMIESYEVIGLIARGGMGMVFEALDPGLMRRVAIKVLIPQLAASPEARARFLREARAAAAIDHPNVLPVYAVGECQGFPYLVMPLVVGESLHHRLKRNGPLPLDDLLRIALATARGLAAAHERNLIHRDIKPDNVLLETGGGSRVWLADFGLARAVHDSGLTRTGAIAGTPQFLSPEQAAGREVDLRSDLFSFGSMLYAMATGGPPFDERAPIAVLRRITEDSPPPPSEKRNDLPPALEDLIAHLMQKAPDDRPASALEIVES